MKNSANQVLGLLLISVILSGFQANARYKFTGAIGMPNFVFRSPIGVAIDEGKGWLYVVNAGCKNEF